MGTCVFFPSTDNCVAYDLPLMYNGGDLVVPHSVSAVRMSEVTYREQTFISHGLKFPQPEIQAPVALLTRQALLCVSSCAPRGKGLS